MIKNNNVVAIIPARANSAGCPGKNYRDIAGKPLFIWSVEAALQSNYIDTIVISTNDSKIEEIINEYKKNKELNKNIVVIRRPESLSGPDSKTEFAMIHALCYLNKNLKMAFDIVCLLQPTSPARRNNLIDKCLEKMVFEQFDSILTVVEKTPFFWNIRKYPSIHSEVFYPLNKFKIENIKSNERYVAYPSYSLQNRPMRQNIDLTEMTYHDNGNFYACYSNVITNIYQRVGSSPALFVTDFFESLQIDTEDDFLIMQKMYELYGRFV